MSALADQTRFLDATAQAELVRSGEVSASDLVEAAIERIEALDGPINAVNYRWFDEARERARGDLPDGPFRGVPFLLKDLFAPYQGQPMSNGNRPTKERGERAPFDSTLVARQRAAGLVTLGRTASPEFGSVAITEPLAWGPTRNPWDLDRSPGGSSGGSAAAVAAGMVPVAHASDGGGSIRIPASACGLVGLKVSQGRISMGPIRTESGLSVEHAVTRTVRDTAALLDATRGPGVGDTVIAPPPVRPYLDEVGADPGRLRIGVLDHALRARTDDECTLAARNAAALLAGLGHVVDEAWPEPLGDPSLGATFGALWRTTAAREALELAEELGRPLQPGDLEPVNEALAGAGRNVTGVEYALALAATADVRRRMHAWWEVEGWDLLLTPTMATEPLPIGLADGSFEAANEAMLRASVFTSPFNVTGQPAISLPLHRTAKGLPIGVQLVAAYGREDVLIRVAAQLEQAAPWATFHPTT
jgi:amidase